MPRTYRVSAPGTAADDGHPDHPGSQLVPGARSRDSIVTERGASSAAAGRERFYAEAVEPHPPVVNQNRIRPNRARSQALAIVWPFAWWVGVVLDHFSRAPVAGAVFKKEPTAEQICALLDATVPAAGRPPLEVRARRRPRSALRRQVTAPLALVVTPYEGRAELPVAELREAA